MKHISFALAAALLTLPACSTNKPSASLHAASIVTVGETGSADERLCMDPAIREARRNAGQPCLADTPAAPDAIFTEVCLDPAGYPYTDPKVIARACPSK